MFHRPLRKWLEQVRRPMPSGIRPRRTFLGVEALEDRSLLTVSVLSTYPGIDFTGSNGSTTPPDATGAAGTTNYVEAVNQTINVFTPKTTGTTTVTSSLNNFWFTAGGRTTIANFNLIHPTLVWDDQIDRFIVGEQYVNTTTHASQFFLAISIMASPSDLTAANWRFFTITTTEAGFDAQNPGNMGYNADALVFTLNMVPTGAGNTHVQVDSVSIVGLLANTLTNFHNDVFGNVIVGLAKNLRPVVMHDATPGGPEFLIQETGDNSDLTVYSMTNVLTNFATFTPTVLPVNPYVQAVPPLQPGIGSPSLTLDSSIQKAAEQSNVLVAAQTVSTPASNEDHIRWYTIDVTGGTPTLIDQGNVGGGPGVYDYYPAIDINGSTEIGMGFMQSSLSQFASMYVTGRTPFDPAGTMQTPALVKAGSDNTTFAGTYSGINVDQSNGTFYAVNDFGVTEPANNWGTAIANFTITFPFQVFGLSTTEGQPLNNVVVAAINGSVGPLSDFNATINWGDGTTTGGQIVSNGSGGLFVLGSHTYVTPGSYTLSVTITNPTLGLSNSGSAAVSVADAPLTGTAHTVNTTVFQQPTNVLVATFTDTDTTQRSPSQYTATVTFFGTDSGTHVVTGRIVPLGNNTFAVFADSPDTFSTAGIFGIRVFVKDLLGGSSVTINSILNVAHVSVPSFLPMYLGDTGPMTQAFLSLQDALVGLLIAETGFNNALSGPPTAFLRAMFNLENASTRYQMALFEFDLSLVGLGM